MKSFLALFGGLICSLLGSNSALAQSLTGFAGQFDHPQFISNNDVALKFRLALLDYAAKGAQVRAATYTWDDGKATQALMAHMCAAVERGVNVEVIVDSKSGQLAGTENPFNATPAAKESEADYQALANCGVTVYIHNYSMDYVTLALVNKRVPNIFGAGIEEGSTIDLITADLRVQGLRDRLALGLKPTLAANHVNADPSGMLKTVQSMILNIAELLSGSTLIQNNPTLLSPISPEAQTLANYYQSFLTDPFWTAFNPKDPKDGVRKMSNVTKTIVKLLEVDPILRDVRDRLRVYNRLNHRKLFMVQEPGGESCVIIGGRNLGDAYLTSGSGSYRDGDVFFCRRQVPTMDKFLTEANASLDQLRPGPGEDLSDKVINSSVKNRLVKVPRRQVVAGARVASVSTADLKGDDLGNIANPELLTSSWDPQADGVRRALLEAILRERKQIYIETAYGEFNSSLRRALETAMKSGVKVHIVTNGMFMADGASKLIRLWMAKWNEDMKAAYPDLFEADFAPLSAAHMIHFKGAAFQCQAGVNGKFYREYIVGSHNFHPRSGYSDKEHAIEWQEPIDASCPAPESDLVSLRMDYYKQQRELEKTPVLRIYSSLREELVEVSQESNDSTNSGLAKDLLYAMYNNGTDLVDAAQLEWIQTLLDQGGLRDLIGILL